MIPYSIQILGMHESAYIDTMNQTVTRVPGGLFYGLRIFVPFVGFTVPDYCECRPRYRHTPRRSPEAWL